MVQAIINISDHTNHILNIVKAKNDLRDKSEAINVMATEYEEEIMEPQLRPSYVEKAKRIMENKKIKVENVDNLRKILKM